MFVSLVFSFRNEEKNLNELIKRSVEVLKKNEKYEIIFVDDASNDKSLEIAVIASIELFKEIILGCRLLKTPG